MPNTTTSNTFLNLEFPGLPAPKSQKSLKMTYNNNNNNTKFI